MLYFYKNNFDNLSSDKIEELIRNNTYGRNVMPDWNFDTTNAGDKIFIGFENEKFIFLVRNRSFIFDIVPKIIIRIEKKNYKVFKLRLSYHSFIYGVIIFLFTIFSFIITGNKELSVIYLIPSILINFLYFTLSTLEFILTSKVMRSLVE